MKTNRIRRYEVCVDGCYCYVKAKRPGQAKWIGANRMKRFLGDVKHVTVVAR